MIDRFVRVVKRSFFNEKIVSLVINFSVNKFIKVNNDATLILDLNSARCNVLEIDKQPTK